MIGWYHCWMWVNLGSDICSTQLRKAYLDNCVQTQQVWLQSTTVQLNQQQSINSKEFNLLDACGGERQSTSVSPHLCYVFSPVTAVAAVGWQLARCLQICIATYVDRLWYKVTILYKLYMLISWWWLLVPVCCCASSAPQSPSHHLKYLAAVRMTLTLLPN